MTLNQYKSKERSNSNQRKAKYANVSSWLYEPKKAVQPPPPKDWKSAIQRSRERSKNREQEAQATFDRLYGSRPAHKKLPEKVLSKPPSKPNFVNHNEESK